MQKLQTNFKNCIHVLARNLEHLLFLHVQMKAAVQRVFNLVVGRYQKVRLGRSYARKSMKPESKWRPSNPKKKIKEQPQTIEAAAAPA